MQGYHSSYYHAATICLVIITKCSVLVRGLIRGLISLHKEFFYFFIYYCEFVQCYCKNVVYSFYLQNRLHAFFVNVKTYNFHQPKNLLFLLICISICIYSILTSASCIHTVQKWILLLKYYNEIVKKNLKSLENGHYKL